MQLSISEIQKTWRLFAWRYLRILTEAEESCRKGGCAIREGLSRFDDEATNIQRAQRWSEMHTQDDEQAARLCSMFPIKGSKCLCRRLEVKEALRWAEAGLCAAQCSGNHYEEALNLGNLGNVYLAIGKTKDALELFERALAIARAADIADRVPERGAVCYLSQAYLNLGETDRAITYFKEWLNIARETGDRQDEGTALGNIGVAYAHLGDTGTAKAFCEQSLQITREIGNRKGEADTLTNLGIIHAQLSDYTGALGLFKQALAITRDELRDHGDESDILANIGLAYMRLGELQQAQETLQQCVDIDRKYGDFHREGLALFRMSQLLEWKGDRSDAIANAKLALEILESLEDPYTGHIRMQLKKWGS